MIKKYIFKNLTIFMYSKAEWIDVKKDSGRIYTPMSVSVLNTKFNLVNYMYARPYFSIDRMHIFIEALLINIQL